MSFLQYLSEKGIKNIPSILFCEKLDDYFVFIQTTCKTIHSTVFHKITPFHIDFAKEIYEKTKTKIPFVETGLYNDLRYLESILDNIATNDREILRNGINSIVTYSSNPQPIGLRGNLLVKRQKFFYCTYSLGITETS